MKTIVIEGMMCNHCQAKVEKALKELGIEAKVSFEKGKAWTDNQSVNDAKIKEAIDNLGFEVKEITND